MAHLKIYETINQLVGEIIALDNTDAGFKSSAEVIANKINDHVAEMIILAGIKPVSTDATSAETISKRPSDGHPSIGNGSRFFQKNENSNF